MKATLPDGTTIEGTKEEIEKYLPPVPQRNWDGPTRERRYTAQEMRDKADAYGRNHPMSDIPDMLRQAADEAEEIAQLRSRPEAVVWRCGMSAEEIRRLAKSRAIFKLHCRSGNLLPRCREWCPSEEAKKCKESDEIRAALLAYAAMVERCEESLKCNFVAKDGRTTINSAVKAQVNYILKGATDEDSPHGS